MSRVRRVVSYVPVDTLICILCVCVTTDGGKTSQITDDCRKKTIETIKIQVIKGLQAASLRSQARGFRTTVAPRLMSRLTRESPSCLSLRNQWILQRPPHFLRSPVQAVRRGMHSKRRRRRRRKGENKYTSARVILLLGLSLRVYFVL